MTQKQKLIVILNVVYEIVLLSITAATDWEDCLFESRIAQFFTLSSPVLLYWAGVWVWGFGYIKPFLKNTSDRLGINKQNCLVSLLATLVLYILILCNEQTDIDLKDVFIFLLQFSAIVLPIFFILLRGLQLAKIYNALDITKGNIDRSQFFIFFWANVLISMAIHFCLAYKRNYIDSDILTKHIN